MGALDCGLHENGALATRLLEAVSRNLETHCSQPRRAARAGLGFLGFLGDSLGF